MPEEVQSITPIITEPVITPPVMPDPVIPVPKKSPWPLILFLLLTATLAIASYFYWQNIQLKSQLTINAPPILSPSPSTDSTLYWQEYINTTHNFTFKYPVNLLLRSYGGSQVTAEEADKFVIEGPYENIETQAGGPEYAIQVEVSSSKPNIESAGEKIVAYKELQGKYVIFTMSESRIPKEGISDPNLLNQILSTFKLIRNVEANLDTTGWQKYENSEFIYQNKVYSGYRLLFPPACTQEGSSIDCKLAHDSGTIIVNAGGHGGEPGNYKTLKSNEPKIIPAGSGKITQVLNLDTNFVTGTFWIEKTDLLSQEPIFGFEFMHVPYQDLAEFEKLFDTILSTFTFTK
jgi:hypothetical protein